MDILENRGQARFANTHWSVVRRAASADSEAALESLCRDYWPPLYAFVRRRGYSVEDAQDLTQAFFAQLLNGDNFRGLDPAKGKFRSFLLAALEHFLANQWRNSRAQKRGGEAWFISFDEEVEASCEQALQTEEDPVRCFERQWATSLLGHVLARLRLEFVEAGKDDLYEDIKGALGADDRKSSYMEIAARHGLTEAAVKMVVHRMRKRYGELLVAELARTVSDPTEVQMELRALFAATR